MSAIKIAQIEPAMRCNFTCPFCAGGLMAQREISIETSAAAVKLCEDLG